MNKRTFILVSMLALLGLALLIREMGVPVPLASETSERTRLARLEERLRYLDSFRQAQGRIEDRYGRMAVIYAERMARLHSFQIAPGDPGRFAETRLRAQLADGPARQISVGSGESSRLAEGVARVPVSISFTTSSDRHAARTALELGRPETGAVWEELSMIANTQERTIQVSGRLTALVIESAE